jgi:hypothetical protein
MPSKRLTRALLLLAFGIVLAAIAFSLDVGIESGTSATGSAQDDAFLLAHAYSRDGGNDAATGVFVSIQEATKRGTKRGARILLDELPSRTATAGAAMTRARGRVAAVTVSTESGRVCKRAVLGLVSRQQALFVVLGAGIDSDVDTWTAVDRYAVGLRGLRRWWEAEAARCAALAPPAERTSIRASLGSL